MKNSSQSFYKVILLSVLIISVTLTSCAHKPKVIEHGIFAPSRLESVIGQDGVCSINFSEDITLWTFADTITGKWKSEEGRLSADKNEALMDGMLSNSIAWSEKITDKNYKNIHLNFYKEKGRAAQFIKNYKNESHNKHRFWALDGFRTGNKVYVYYLHVYVPDPSQFLNFEVRYVGLARWDIPRGWKPGDKIDFTRLGQLFSKGSPFFGAAVMERDGFVYLAGHFKNASSEFPLSFARVPVEKIEDSTSYSYLSRKGEWVSDIKSAGSFFGDITGECSLSYNNYLKEYVIVYSKVFTGEVTLVRFKDFSRIPSAEKEIVLKVYKAEGASMWPYSGKEIFSSGNSLFLIYIDPARYQPLLVELRY
jgi:hypothetical protein